MMTMERTEWVSTRYVADALGVSMGKARSLIQENGLQIFAVGNRWRIEKDQADEMIERVLTRGQA